MEEDNTIQLTSIEGLEILLDAEGDTSLRMAQRMLVGKIMVDKPLNRPAVKDILSKAWGLSEELTITDLGPNTFLFNFKEARQARKVVQDGDIVMIEDPYVGETLLRPFLRVRVMINIKKQLVIGFWLPERTSQRSGCPLNMRGVPLARSLVAIATENTRRHKKMNGEEEDVKKGRDHPTDNEGGNPTKSDSAAAAHPFPPTTNANMGQHSQDDTVRVDNSTFLDLVGPSIAPEQHFFAAPPNPTHLHPSPTQTHQAQNIGPPTNPDDKHQLSCVDLEENVIRPSLGPENMEDIRIQTKFIGLAKIYVILDYPSPCRHGNSNYGANLTEEMIHKCKNSWLFNTPPKGTRHDNSPTTVSHSPPLETPDPTPYYVEFPPEDHETSNQPPNSPEKIIVGLLTQEFQKSVNLKRGSDEDPNEFVYNTTSEKRIKVTVGHSLLTLPQPSSQLNTPQLVEEAGLNMPPTQP
ncbi:hypothetical protein SESBI_31588 [Sesbania bispinosa]|nr:hypothetical protein SESBI_31588 [Sesbania bispinosa]